MNWSDITGWLSQDDANLLLKYSKLSTGNVIEFGSYLGRSSVLIASSIGDRYLICLDGFFSDNNKVELFLDNLNKCNIKNVITIKGDFFVTNRNLFAKVGMAFIDGGHMTSCLEVNMECCNKNLIIGGYIVFHDYINTQYPDVKQFVDELIKKGYYQYLEKTPNGSSIVIKRIR